MTEEPATDEPAETDASRGTSAETNEDEESEESQGVGEEEIEPVEIGRASCRERV